MDGELAVSSLKKVCAGSVCSITKRPRARVTRELGKLETGKTQRLVVKCQGAGTARLCAESSDDGIGERALSFLKCDQGRENLLLVLHNDHLRITTPTHAPTDSITSP